MLSWYRLTMFMKHKHGWDIETLGDMYPFEVEVYTAILQDYLEMEKKLAEEAAQGR